MDGVEIAKLVLEFLEKTGVALVQTGFPMAVRYVIAQAIIKILVGVAGVILTTISVTSITRIAKKVDEDSSYGEENLTVVKTIMLIIAGIGGLLMTLFSGMFTGIAMLISPEWYAILNIIDLVK